MKPRSTTSNVVREGGGGGGTSGRYRHRCRGKKICLPLERRNNPQPRNEKRRALLCILDVMGGLAWRHNACSRINFRPLPQRNSSKSDFKDSHISRFCFIFQVIQVISLGKFCSGGEVDLSFISWTIFHERDCKGFFLAKRSWKKIFFKCSNSGINESTPQTQSNCSWISSKAALQISFMKSRWWKKLHENGPKIGPATVVKKPFHPIKFVYYFQN